VTKEVILNSFIVVADATNTPLVSLENTPPVHLAYPHKISLHRRYIYPLVLPRKLQHKTRRHDHSRNLVRTVNVDVGGIGVSVVVPKPLQVLVR
jgi:hypothetical protein